jgi:hypothetical protein
MDDMKQTIIPKSDQINSDDLISGPMTIKITRVEVKGGQEQPVSIYFEGDNGKPYKSCKSMCRVMVSAWGPDSSKYVGRSLTLYRDAKVKWGGMEVGGIRISHMSDIDENMTMALTVTRANKKPFTVRPIIPSHGPIKAAPPQVPQTPAPSLAAAVDATPAAGAAPMRGWSDEAKELFDSIPGIKGPKGLEAAQKMVDALNEFERPFVQTELDVKKDDLERIAATKTPAGKVARTAADAKVAAIESDTI